MAQENVGRVLPPKYLALQKGSKAKEREKMAECIRVETRSATATPTPVAQREDNAQTQTVQYKEGLEAHAVHVVT